MSSPFAVIDAFKGCIAGLDSLWIWGGAVGAMLYAIFDHKDTREEIKAASGLKKKLLRLKLTLLWLLPTFGFIGAYANKLSSEELQAKLGPRTISKKQEEEIVSCFRLITNRGKVVIKASIQDAEATAFSERIESVLKTAGFEVHRPSWIGTSSIASDAVLFSGSIGTTIVVKDRYKAPNWAGLIQKCFLDNGVPIGGGTDPGMNTNDVMIVVGQKL